MKYLSLGQTAKYNYEENMLARNICESVDAAEIQFQAKKTKRYRSAFTTDQINYLEKQFKKFPYIGNACRKEVASKLNIPERAVKIWFQNRRMKEKKDVISKEYNLDRPNNLINNTEFANDSLNNVHSSQSANDRQCSLQLAQPNHGNTINCPYYNGKVKSSEIKFDEYIKEKVMYNKHINDLEKQTISKKMSSTTSKFTSNRNYNNRDFIKYLETNENEAINKCKVSSTKKIKDNYTTGIQSIPDVPNNTLGTISYQDLPEDLSARNKSNVTFPQSQPENINLRSAYIPYNTTQNYITPCISAGSVMWKPINVVPIISSSPSSSLPIAVADNNELNQMNMVKSDCNCNCHMKNILSLGQGKTSAATSHPQYVIAIPINNSSN